ncbi:glutaminyl-peptide cyclotransferase [Corynebacterium pacaense]|uniref:glutaminyl-peptide cyclotransferase n=1 Tax=Corynebacterium pacaense TaxID=1816684 RepID=UPI0009BBF741|nr:glutaminyl-peptide cyclotransferase [Corynebacterium pacaense]
MPLAFKKTLALILSVPVLASSALMSCADTGPGAPRPVEHLRPEIIGTHAFDDSSFTQGLELDGQDLVVGTGQYGDSRIYRSGIDGREYASQDLPADDFGEGITIAGDHIWQLTWKSGIAYKRDRSSLEVLDRVPYPGEGWGICAGDGDVMYMSDGTSTLRTLDPETFEERGRVTVTSGTEPVSRLNELECVGDEIYANIFQSTDIVRIDADSGAVTAVIDASGLPNNAVPDVNNVLNGIAHIPGTDRFYLTGKRWPDLYEVEWVGGN